MQMNNDMSWLGLYRKGIKLEYRRIGTKEWWCLNYGCGWRPEDIIKLVTFEIRYKHSIQ